MKIILKKALAFILASLVILSATSCKSDKDTETTTPSSSEEMTTPSDDGKADFAVGGKCDYKFVYSNADCSEKAINAILCLRIDLRKKFSGSDFTMNKFGNSDSVAEDEKEVLIGITNRKESTELLSALPEKCFGIQVTENKIAIVAKSDRILEDAIKYFTNNYLNPDSDGSLLLEKGIYISDPIEYSISTFISNKEGFSTIHTKLYDIPATGDNRIMQGGCTDGKYIYFCMVNSGEGSQKAYVYKYDLETDKLVKKSELLSTDHSNDMTYNSKTNELIILHNAPNRHLLSVIDPETLEFKRQVRLDYQVYSIAYQPERDVYVIGLSGGENFSVLNANFKLNRDYIKEGNKFTVDKTGYTTQGVACDYDYIYFVLYKENVITVYNWQGERVNIIPLSIPNSTEPENISIVDDTFYIACNNSKWSGGELYRVSLVIPSE